MSRGWGGARPGSGPKPKPKPERTANRLTVFPGGADTSRDALLVPPDTLPKAWREVWAKWAPLAIKRNTLILENVPAFELLCELEVRRVAIGAIIDAATPTPEALRLFSQYSKQVENLFGKFRLAPFGKPEVPEKPKASANPWGAFGAAK